MSYLVYGLGFLLIAAISGVSYYLSMFAKPAANTYYTTNIRFISLYSFGASLLLYGMALYFFSAFPQLSPLLLIGLNTLLLSVSLTSLYFNTWKVNARKEGASGIPTSSPAFIGYAATMAGVCILLGTLVLTFRTMQNRLHLLLLLSTVIAPFFFLTSIVLNTFAFNNFTSGFH